MASSDDIAERIRQRILSGELPPGAELPTVVELAAAEGASNETAAKAYRSLAASGLIITQRGRKALVADTRPLLTITESTYAHARRPTPGTATTFERQCQERGEVARTEHHDAIVTPSAPAYVAELLGTPGPFILLTGEGYASPAPDGKPRHALERVLGFYDTWIPAHLGDAAPLLLEPRDPGPRDRASEVILEEALDVHLSIVQWDIDGRHANGDEAARLGTPPGTGILVESLLRADDDDRPMMLTQHTKLLGLVRWSFRGPIVD